MADALTEIDIEQMQSVIETSIAAAFPSLHTVEFDREDHEGRKAPIVAPACLLDLPEFEDGVDPDPGTGQLAMYARLSAQLILGFRTERVHVEARKLATSLAAYLHLRRWPGVITGPGEVSAIYKDEFDPKLDQYVVWRVDWAHIVHLGTSVWKGEGVAVTQVDVRETNPVGAELDDPFTLVQP